GGDGGPVPGEDADLLPRLHAPQFEHLVAAARQHLLAVGAEQRLRHRQLVAGQRGPHPAGGGLPDLDRLGRAAGGGQLLVRAGRRRPDVALVAVGAGEFAELLAAAEVPQPRRVVVAARGELREVGGKGDAADLFAVAAEGAERLAAGDVPDADALVAGAGGQR